MQTYSIFSKLLMYPDKDFKKNINSITDIIKSDKLFSAKDIKKIDTFISYVDKNSLLFLQELYVSTFDRQKYFSLYLFEHIHGDSRERGMAMVDLKNLYSMSNLEITPGGELPDYIPVFLEFLSLISKHKASTLLGEVVNIIAILQRRLEMAHNPYHIIFSLLESLASIKSDRKIVENVLKSDGSLKPSNTEIDKDWEEPENF